MPAERAAPMQVSWTAASIRGARFTGSRQGAVLLVGREGGL
jgi:hypothetical protein